MREIDKNNNDKNSKQEEDNKKNLYLLLNFDKNFISSSLLEYSKEQHKLSVLSYNKEETNALFNGNIQNINKANDTLKKSLIKLKKVADIKDFSNTQVLCNVNPSLGKKITTRAITNFIENEVTNEDINEVIQKSLNTNNIPENMKLINLRINKFKIDNNWVSNPLGMNCQRLEVDAISQIINSSYFNNFNKILQKSSLTLDFMRFETENIIDATLTEEEKELGSILVYISDYDTKITFIKNSEIDKEENINIGKMSIVEDISTTFKVSFKVANHILKNINLIADSSSEIGYFEIELPDGKIQSIDFNLLVDTISKSLEKLFNEVKNEINNTNNINNYLNGIVFLKTIDMHGIEKFFNEIFKDNIKDVRNFNHLIQSFDNIYNIELLNSEYSLLGMCFMILNEKDFNYNHNMETLSKNVKINGKQKAEKININNLKLSQNHKKESFFDKIKKMTKELW